jgi:hypothetical protein
MDIKKIEKKEVGPTITMPFRLYVKAYMKAIRANPKAKTLTITLTLPCSNRVNAFRSDPSRPSRYDLLNSKEWAWTASNAPGIETISIPLTAAGRAAKRKEHNAPKRESAEWHRRKYEAHQARMGK